MSLSDLFSPVDTTVTVGVVQFSEDVTLPCYIVYYPETEPNYREVLARYRRLTLDVHQHDGSYTFHVSSDRVVTEMTESVLLEMQKAAEAGKPYIPSQGVPEWSSSFTTAKHAHDLFMEAFAVTDVWLLVILAEDATQILVARDGRVIGMRVNQRSAYPEPPLG